MIAFDSTSGHLWRARCARVCFMLTWGAVCHHAMSQSEGLLRDRKEGTLVVNYYSAAPDPALEQLRRLSVDALGVYLRGQISVDSKEIGWARPVKSIQRDMEGIVTDVMDIRQFSGQSRFGGFSDELTALLQDFDDLNARDVDRLRGLSGRGEEERTYVLIEQRLQEILLQAGVELGWFVNKGLLQLIGTVEQAVPAEDFEKWMTLDENDVLEPLELDFSLETMSLLGGEDGSSWPGSEAAGRPDNSGQTEEMNRMQSMLERVIVLLESQDARISALEKGGETLAQTARDSWSPARPSPQSDASLQSLNLPTSFDVQFYEGSSRLTLTAQLQLNEVLELMGIYPQLRVVCTGHADVKGDRVANLSLSKQRAQVVRAHLLESGVASTRVVLNYFGEERATNQGALDRRVEVAFFVGD